MEINKHYLYFFCLILIGCSNNKNPYANNQGIEPSEIAQIDTAHYTQIKWQDSILDFGTIKSTDSASVKYKFTNVGKTPLFIIQAFTSCGCTVTSFSKDPIMPGNSGFISVTIKGNFHTGKMNKTILVKTNTKKSMNSILVLKGEILAAK